MTDRPAETEPKGTPGAALVAIDQAPFTFKTIQAIAGTDLVPKALRNNPEGMLAVILAGREFGLPPMASLRQIDLIEGTPAPSGELLLSLIRKAGHTVIPIEVTPERAVVKGIRDPYSDHPEEWTFEFTMADAERIMVEQWVGGQSNRHKESTPITEKSNWKNYPQFMLFWRAVTGLARMFFSDVVQGFAYVAEELSEGDGPFQIPDGIELERAAGDPNFDPLARHAGYADDVVEAEIVEDEPPFFPNPPAPIIPDPDTRFPHTATPVVLVDPDLEDPGRPFEETSSTSSSQVASPEPPSDAEAVAEQEGLANVLDAFPGSVVVPGDDEADLYSELIGLIEGDQGDGWAAERATVDGLKARTKRLYELAALLEIWPADAYTKGLNAWTESNPAGLEHADKITRPLTGMTSLRVKGNMLLFAQRTIGWMRTELRRRTEQEG